jgi:hypothetical protein
MFNLPYGLTPVKFHRYTSRTMNRIFEIRYDEYNFKLVQELRQELLEKFNRFKITARDDNKIVFECCLDGDNLRKVCYGFYDGNFSIGLSYYDENEAK